MPNDLLMALIAVVSGGGLTAILNVLIERNKSKKALKDKDIDDRILAWQQISDRNETRMESLEQKLVLWERDVRSLERYVLSLEQMIALVDPTLKLPERPVMEHERS